jgi:hypothetical protein
VGQAVVVLVGVALVAHLMAVQEHQAKVLLADLPLLYLIALLVVAAELVLWGKMGKQALKAVMVALV